MSQRINRVSPGSAGKIFGAMYFVLGILFVPFLALPALLAGGDGAGLSLGLTLGIPRKGPSSSVGAQLSECLESAVEEIPLECLMPIACGLFRTITVAIL